MAPETAATRPARNGPRLRQTRPERRPGGTGPRVPMGAAAARAMDRARPIGRSAMDVRESMSSNSRREGVAALNDTWRARLDGIGRTEEGRGGKAWRGFGFRFAVSGR